MELRISEKGKVTFEIECDNFRECYDLITWLGGYNDFTQFNGNASEHEYETHIRKNDMRAYAFDRQKETETIELQRLDDMIATIRLQK